MPFDKRKRFEMAKLSKYLLKALLLPFCKASEKYETVSCINDQNVRNQILSRVGKCFFFQKPELTLRIEQSHFDSNFEGQEGEFQFENGFYKKTVPEEDLVVSFDDDNDGK